MERAEVSPGGRACNARDDLDYTGLCRWWSNSCQIEPSRSGVAPGEWMSPATPWANIRAGTQSFVLKVSDMDLAPTGYRRSGPLGGLGHPGIGNRRARRCAEGIAIARRKLSDQRHGTHASRSGPGRD